MTTRTMRDKHPARGARILTTGISVAATLGLTSAYAIAAQNMDAATAATNSLALATQPIAAAPIATLVPAAAPSLPAAAAPAQVASPTVAPVPQTATPQVTIKVPKKHKRAATTSSGSH